MASVTSVNLISDMVALSPSDQDQVSVSGYWFEADGGGGIFYYDASSSATPDAGSVIAPSSGVGRWLRVMAGPGGSSYGGPASAVSVKWWGAKGTNQSGDATTNVTAFNAAIAYAYGLSNTANNCPGAVYIPSGTYCLNGTVNVLGDVAECVTLFGDGKNNTVLSAISGDYTTSPGLGTPRLLLWIPESGGEVQEWSIKKMAIYGYGSSGLNLVDLSCGANHGVAEELHVSGNSSPSTGIAIYVNGHDNSIRDCLVGECNYGYSLNDANAFVMQRCYASANNTPIQIESGLGIFINATWESNYGPVVVDDVVGCTFYNCYTENNGPETPTSSLGNNTQIVAGYGTTGEEGGSPAPCRNLVIIGGSFDGGDPATSDNQQNQYMFEWYDVDGYSFLNPDASSGGVRLILRAGSLSTNPGIMSFNHLSVGSPYSPDASVVDHVVNYFPNPNFELGFNPNNANDLGCYTVGPIGGVGGSYTGPTLALYNYYTAGGWPTFVGDYVRYGTNSIQITGNGVSGSYGLSFTLPWYMTTALLGKTIRVAMLVKCVPVSDSSNYATNAAVPSISIPYFTTSAVDAYLGDNWILVISNAATWGNQSSQIEVDVSGCASSQTITAGDILYVDSIWIVPSNFSTQQLLAGNVKSLEVAKYQVFRNNPGDPTSGTYVLTPNFIGEEVLDTGSNAWYKAIGTGSGDWQAL
jgi:hypothetical protein